MNRFDWHLVKQLVIGMIFVTAGLTGVLWLSQSLRFIDLIVNRGLGAGTFFHLVMLLLPNYLLVIVPIAMFSAVLFTYTKLINDREIMVMQAAGVGPLGVARPALIVAGLVTIGAYGLYFTVLPTSYRLFRELQWEIRYSFSHVLLEEGTFTDVGDKITVYVRERSADGQLRGILVHDRRNPEKPYTLMAERGALTEGDNGPRVVLFNGSRQEVDPKTHDMSILYFDRYAFELEQARQGGIKRFREPRERTLAELFAVDRDPTVLPNDRGRFVVEAHRRLTAPLSSLGFTMIALACLLSAPFRRRGQAYSNLLAIGIVMTLALGALGLENVAARKPSLVPLLYVMALLPIFGGGLFLAWQPRRRSRAADHPAVQRG